MKGIDFSNIQGIPALYTRQLPPFPGSSIGPKSSDTAGTAGTLTAYVKHTKVDPATLESVTTVYGLTCAHVVGAGEAMHAGIQVNSIAVESPAHVDHSCTLSSIENNHMKQPMLRDPPASEILKKNGDIVRNFDNTLGTVSATGAVKFDPDKLGTEVLDCRDWAIISEEQYSGQRDSSAQQGTIHPLELTRNTLLIISTATTTFLDGTRIWIPISG